MEKTLVMIKPDGVQRRMVGTIVSAIETRPLTISQMVLRTLQKKEAEELYAEHKGKWFFARNVSHVTSGPVVLIQVEGEHAVGECRDFVEGFRKSHADVIVLPKNLVHATDSKSKSEKELQSVGLIA